MSVLSPIVPSPTYTTSYNILRATWTVMAGQTGSFPINIVAHSNFPYDTETFSLTVNVGSPNSLMVTAINIPGNIVPGDNFTVSIKLNNTSTVKDHFILAQVAVPAGLQLLNNSTLSVDSLNPNREVAFNWRLNAQAPGSYPLIFNYSSINSGSNSIKAYVNVGSVPIATGALLSISAEPIVLEQNAITPVTFDISNNSTYPIHHLQIVSATGGAYTSVDTPANIGDLEIGATKKETLGIYTTNESLTLKVPIDVKYDANGVNYNETYLTELPLQNQANFKISSVVTTPPLSFAGDVADKIDVQIFNLGQGANDVHVALNLPKGLSPAWGNATSVYFGRIDTFQTVTASFYINIDTTSVSGNYPLTLLITSGNQKTSLNINYVIAKKAIFQLVSVDSSQLYPGATNVPFTITLKNIGSAPAETLTTMLLSGNAVPGVKSSTITAIGNEENIGTILPNQVFTTTFLVALDPAFPAGDQSTSVEINWTQNSTYAAGTNSFVQTVAVPYHIPNGPYYLLYYNGVPWTIIVVVVIGIVLIAIFIKRRKRRLKTIELAALQAGGIQTEGLDMARIQASEDISAQKENTSEKKNPV
ncbi:MAG: hypothetical protein KGI25_00175 [Thaumarchaeota archaeon]|nr:hypothetical protein [Nitrososphaerota archaeon]